MNRKALARTGLLMLLVLVPATALAAGDAHAGPPWKELGSQIVNFIIYIALIVYVAKKPVLEFFQARRDDVTATMEASKKAAAEATARLAETRAKMDAFDAERQAILDEFRELGESERRRIVAQAEADAARIVRDAEIAAEREMKMAKATLEARMVDIALEKAGAELAAKMNPATQAKLIDNGIDALAGAAN